MAFWWRLIWWLGWRWYMGFVFIVETDLRFVFWHFEFCVQNLYGVGNIKFLFIFSFVFEIDWRLVILNFCTSIFVFEIDMELVEQKQLIWETPHLLGLQSAFERNQVMIENYHFCHALSLMRMLCARHWTKRYILANKRRCSQVWKVSWQ